MKLIFFHIFEHIFVFLYIFFKFFLIFFSNLDKFFLNIIRFVKKSFFFYIFVSWFLDNLQLISYIHKSGKFIFFCSLSILVIFLLFSSIFVTARHNIVLFFKFLLFSVQLVNILYFFNGNSFKFQIESHRFFLRKSLRNFIAIFQNSVIFFRLLRRNAIFNLNIEFNASNLLSFRFFFTLFFLFCR